MTINKYVKQWYDENYDIRKEAFYVENARWVAVRGWYNGGIIHGVVAALVAVMYIFSHPISWAAGFEALLLLSALTVAFLFYAINNYDANDKTTSLVIYVLTLLFLVLTKPHVSIVGQWIFIIGGLALYIYLTIIKPISLWKIKESLKHKMEEMEKEEEEADKKTYSQWESEYKSYRYGLPEYDIPTDDPALIEARKMFEGYTDSKEMLKNRYRQLAKQMHPDNGGDERMFQCISEVYEELQQKTK